MSKILSFFKIFSKLFGGGNNWIFGVLMLISLFTKKKKPVTTSSTQTSSYQSPTYSWDNIADTSEVDAPLPIVFGTHKIGGNIINTHIITNITDMDKIEVVPIKWENMVFDDTNYKITTFLDTGGIKELTFVYGCPNGTYIPEGRGNVTVGFSLYKHTTGECIDSCTHTFAGQHYTGNWGQQAPKQQVTETLKNLDPTYTGGYDAVITYMKEAHTDYRGTTYYSQPTFYRQIIPLSFNKKTGVYSLGSVNEYSAQTLQMDIGLSIGQIENVKFVTVNDQPVEGYTSTNRYGQNQIRINFDWKSGYDFLIEENLNKTITGQSSVFNQNKAISRLWAVLITQPAPLGATTIYVSDNSLFLKDGGGYNNLKIGEMSHVVVGLQDNDKVLLGEGNKYNVPEAGKYWATVAADEITIKNTGKFTDFDYITQFDYVDGLDVALVAPSGLYLINQETGAYLENKIIYQVYIGHDALWDDGQPHDIRLPQYHFYEKEVTLSGNRRGKIWYNLQLNDSILKSLDGKKKYRIKIRKVSRDSIDSSNNMNDLNIAYVEEIKNKDLYYNGLAYATLNLPADPRLNGGNPSFAFTLDGVRVPKLLHKSLTIKESLNNNTVIHTKNVGGEVNCINYNTEYTLNSPMLVMQLESLERFGVSSEYENILTHEDYTIGRGVSYNYNNIVTCFFKCGNTWHKRYCLFGNKVIGENTNLYDYYGCFVILTYDNILAMMNNPAEFITFKLSTKEVAKLQKIKAYMDYDPYLKEYNQPLPSAPTDMLTYVWSKNPANALLYLLTDDNGLKVPLQYIDLDSFREAEAYFNEQVDDLLNLGKKMPRCELNFVIDTIANIRSHIDKICSTCHASLLESNGKIKLKIDRQEVSEYSLDEDEDLLPDSLKVISLPDKDLPNQINITFLNAAKDYAKEIITIEDVSLVKQYGTSHIRKLDMDLFGVTSASQVYREGLMLLKQAKYIQYTIVFKTGVSGFPLEVGSVFTLTSTTHGFTNKLFRVMNIKYDEKQECEVTAIEYFDTIHQITNEDKLSFPSVNHSELPNPSKKPDAIKNLTVTEYNEQSNSGDIVTSVVGTFQAPDRPSFKNNNMIAFLGKNAIINDTTIYLKSLDEARRLNLGDKIAFNFMITDSDIAVLESQIPIANLVPNSPAMQAYVEVAQETVDAIYAKTPYTIQGIDYSLGTVTISPALTTAYNKDSSISTISYNVGSKYEFSKYSHVVASLIKVADDGVRTIIFDKEKFEGTVVKFATAELGKYCIIVYSVSANGIIGDPVVSDIIELKGKLIKPPSVLNVTVAQYKYKHVYRISWENISAKDLKTYQLDIVPKFVSDPPVETVTKKIIYPLEYTHTFATSGAYDIILKAINTSDQTSAEYTETINVVVEITENFLSPYYTLHNNVIQLSWNAIETLAELPRYEVYINDNPFVLQNPLLPFDPVTNQYIGLTSSLRAWEGTSTQIPIANLPETGAPLSFDTEYYIVLVAKYKYNEQEQRKQAPVLVIPSLAGTAPIIAFYASVPPLETDNLIAANHFKPQIIAVPDSGVTAVWGRIYKVGEIASPQTGFLRFTKVAGLWERDFTSLVDGDYQLEVVGASGSGDDTNVISMIIKVDTSIPEPLPRPVITKDNTYVQTMLISYSAQTTTPFTGGDTIDIFNSKTIQITLEPFTTCSNFSHIKVYIGEYDKSLKRYGAYTEYKIPQATGIGSNILVPNFKASITFAEDMPDFRIKMVMVKKNGIEGSLFGARESVRNKIDTTPPLIKINSITYDGDTTNFNLINNDFINAKLNVGAGLLFNLSITELNSGLWSKAVDIANLRIPVYYQINTNAKMPLYQKDTTRFVNPFLIPKEAFAGIAEDAKATITIYALDNALKVGTSTFTKKIDTIAPNDVTSVSAVFGVEANKGVIKFTWTNPTNSDLAGVRLYENNVLVKETTGQTASIPTDTGATRTFVIKAYDYANNESVGITKEAINYPPKQVTGLVANSDSGAISLTWDSVTHDTNNDIMTDLKHYQISYYNPNTGLTVTTNYTTDTHFVIKMTPSDVKYFNAHKSDLIEHIKVRAVDFFGAEGAYSDETSARPRFIEAVDMTGNIFKFVPTILGGYTGNTEHIVDANYKNDEYITLTNVSQGSGIKLDMKPEYIAETKVKFVGSVSSFARFILHYRLQNPTTLEESDLYLASTTHSIDSLYETTNISEAYTNYIQVSLTDIKVGTEKDKENNFTISLMKSELTRKSFYITYATLLFASGNPTNIGISEFQPRVRSIANEFYGETLMLSNMFSIRSSEDTANYIETDRFAMRVYGSSLLKVKIGYISEQAVYGAWFKDNVYIGGTSPADAPIRFESAPVINVGGLTANNSYVSVNNGSGNAFSTNNGLSTGYFSANTYGANMTIDGGTIKTSDGIKITNKFEANSTDAILTVSGGTIKTSMGVATTHVDINATQAVVGKATANSQVVANGSTTDVKQVCTDGWAQFTQYYLAFGTGTYGVKANAKAVFGQLDTGVYGAWMTNGVYIGGSGYSTAALRVTAADSGLIELGYISANLYNMKIEGAGVIRIGHVTGTSYNMLVAAGSLNLGYSANGYNFYMNTTELKMKTYSESVYNLYMASGYIGLGYTGGYYNTKITSGAINLGHLSSGTSYALTMDYSGAESTRHFTIKGSDLNEFFRVGYFLTYSGYAYRTAWTKQMMITDAYSQGYIGDLARNSYLFISRNSIYNGIIVTGDGGGTGTGIYSFSSTTTAICGESSSGKGVYGVSSSSYGVRGESSTGIGVNGYASGNYGGYFDSGWTYSLASVKESYLNGKVTCGSSLYVTTWASFQSTIYAPNIGTGTGTTPTLILEGGYIKVGSSSIRYKENIQPLTTNRVLELEPKTFTWKETKRNDIGLIAEQVNEIIPELVGWYKGQIQTVDYAKITVLLLDVVKKQQKDIEELKKLVDNLIKA